MSEEKGEERKGRGESYIFVIQSNGTRVGILRGFLSWVRIGERGVVNGSGSWEGHTVEWCVVENKEGNKNTQ